MFGYILKRLLLFIPTLFLVSCLTFFLSKQVPVDQVEVLLELQGVDESNERWEKEYQSLSKRMGLHLPDFYFSIYPSYSINTKNDNLDLYEKKFVENISSQKYTKTYIHEILTVLDRAPKVSRNQLLSSSDLHSVKNKAESKQVNLSDTIVNSLLPLLEKENLHKVKWHYPVVRFNGIQNQYHRYLVDVFKGDFGVSLLDTRPVTDKLWEAMRWSLLLVFLNLFFAILISFPIGVYNGMKPNSRFDKTSNTILFGFYAVPKFWMATVMIIFFTTSEYGAWTNIFPVVGRWYTDGAQDFIPMLANSWHKLILPVLILVIPDSAYLSRLIRSSVQEESKKEYIKTARSKGMSTKAITLKHVLPNSLIPTISLLVGALPGALASGLVIEVIFNIPGIGRLMYESINSADWAMVYPIVLIISILTVLIFLAGDILMAFLNPKIKLG